MVWTRLAKPSAMRATAGRRADQMASHLQPEVGWLEARDGRRVVFGVAEVGIDSMLNGQAKLDAYSQDHLQETSARIAKVVDAKMLVSP